MISSYKKLTESVLALSRRLSDTPTAEAAMPLDAGATLLVDISEYVAALCIYFAMADGEVADDELVLLRSFLEDVDGLSSVELPKRDHYSWAEERIYRLPVFLSVAIVHDRNEGDCSCSFVMWHIRQIILSIIGADGHYSDEELRVASFFLQSVHCHLSREGIEWSYELFDHPAEAIAAISNQKPPPLPGNHDGDTVDECLAELADLIGLEGVKREVATLVNLVRVRKLRAERGMKMPEMSLHMVFSGNPGTGKTTVGRLLGKIYRALAILPKGHLLEVDRSGLVAGYVGQTALKTTEALRKAQGGILFIDEAYALCSGREDDYGQEAIDTILKYMEDHRDELVVIVAGYEDHMARFVKSNPGLRSRFNKFIHFEDYSIGQLYSIFLKLVENHSFYYNEQVAQTVYDGLQKRATESEYFANARTVRNFFEEILQQQANRLANLSHTDDRALHIIEESDVLAALS